MIVAYLQKHIDAQTMSDLASCLPSNYYFTYDSDSECIVIVRND